MQALSVSSIGPPMRKKSVSIPCEASDRARSSDPVSDPMRPSLGQGPCVEDTRNRLDNARPTEEILCTSRPPIDAGARREPVNTISRRTFLKGSSPLGFAGLGGVAPAFSQTTKLHLLQWVDVIPERDAELRRQIAEYSQRSEERRVGKECRSRWSPDH